MEVQPLESIVYCPNCNEQVHMVIKPCPVEVGGILKMFESIMDKKAAHFEGDNKCKCGMTVEVVLHVSAEKEARGNKDDDRANGKVYIQ